MQEASTLLVAVPIHSSTFDNGLFAELNNASMSRAAE
jgi:hypothetical protein